MGKDYSRTAGLLVHFCLGWGRAPSWTYIGLMDYEHVINPALFNKKPFIVRGRSSTFSAIAFVLHRVTFLISCLNVSRLRHGFCRQKRPRMDPLVFNFQLLSRRHPPRWTASRLYNLLGATDFDH
jgi:hypothetical protein